MRQIPAPPSAARLRASGGTLAATATAVALTAAAGLMATPAPAAADLPSPALTRPIEAGPFGRNTAPTRHAAWTLGPAADADAERMVTPDLAALQAVRPGDVLVLPLGAAGRVDATITHRRTPAAGALVLRASTDGQSGDVAIAVRGESIAAVIFGPAGRSARIMPTPGGPRMGPPPADGLSECVIDPGAAGDRPTPFASPAGTTSDTPGFPGSPGSPTTGGCDDGSIIDVLCLFTTASVAQLGSVEAVEAVIDLQIETGTMALANSDVPAIYRLVYAREVDVDEDALSLGAMRDPDDGFLDSLHPLRDAYAADLVALIRSGGGGVAYGLSDLNPEFEDRGLSINGVNSAPYVLPHELGHNLGCCHAVGDGGGCNVGLLFDDSNGHRWFDGLDQYRTIMAYSPGGRIAHYSNPDVMFQGQPTGVLDEADNGRTLQISRTLVASYRCEDLTCVDLALPSTGGDCNANDIPDACEIALGLVADENGDGVPDECGCIGDIDDDGAVGIGDLLSVLSAWGECTPGLDCDADISQDGLVGIDDLLIVLAQWENC